MTIPNFVGVVKGGGERRRPISVKTISLRIDDRETRECGMEALNNFCVVLARCYGRFDKFANIEEKLGRSVCPTILSEFYLRSVCTYFVYCVNAPGVSLRHVGMPECPTVSSATGTHLPGGIFIA